MTFPPQYPHASVRATRWWQHPALIAALLVLLPPIGIALAWTSRWRTVGKAVATVLAGLWFLVPLLGDPPDGTADDAKPAAAPATPAESTSAAVRPPDHAGQGLRQAKAAAAALGFRTVSHDAGPEDAAQADEDAWRVCFQTTAQQPPTGPVTLDFAVVRAEWPCPARDGDPIPYPAVPKVVGRTFAEAGRTLAQLAFRAVEPKSAYTDVALAAAADDWTVCFQEPEAGQEVRSARTTTAVLQLTAPGTGCPAAPGATLHPAAALPPAADDDPDDGRPTTSGGTAAGGTTGSGSGSGSGGSGSGSTGGARGAGTVTPGAFCSPAGATGVSKAGAVYTCKGPGQNRWRR
ncbi:PASTA domain-containing protein [Streptomyces sp. NPDC059851]|uniref:PASTA domain-containing protein n=1 Tax=Streptomyces sp. NPDC059851 TaxID=3346971 RepID=UPI003648F7C0